VNFRRIVAFLVCRPSGAAALIFLAAGLVACSPKKEAPRPRPPAPVTVAQVTQQDVPQELRAVGNVEAYTTVAVKALVSGTVAGVHFREGQDVAQGQLLFTIDPRPFQAALRQAEANLAKNQAQATNAEAQARRYAALVKDGIVTQEQYDQLKTSADALAASVAADRAAVENAKVQLSFCYIHAPLVGRTGNLVVNAGNIVKANDNPAMVTINQISPVYVTFAVPEKELLTIKRQMAGGTLRVEAAIPSDPHGPNSGTVTFIDNTVDMATGTIKLKGTFANAERRLWPGQFVNVTLTLAVLAKATVVPSQAVQTGQQGQYVFVVLADGTAELRPVTAGISHGGVMVIEKGLAPGESVVTDGQMRLMPGAKVEVKQPGQGGGTKVPAAASGAGGPTGASPATGGAAPPAQPTSGAGLHGSKP